METQMHDEAVKTAFETALEKFDTIQALVSEIRSIPADVANTETICNTCLMHLTLSIAALLSKISQTDVEGLLAETGFVDPRVIDEFSSTEEASETIN